MRIGRRRAREAMVATGSESILDALRYWALLDHNAEVEVVVYGIEFNNLLPGYADDEQPPND
jgi:hypothetical protein